MFKGKDIVCISPIDWDFLWQRHQIFMKMLAETGNRIFYVENIHPSPSLDLSFVPKALKRVFRIIFRIHGQDYKDVPNIRVITPFVLPFKNPIADFINKKILIKLLACHIKSLGAKNPVIWTYLATSATLELIDSLKPEMVIYDCVFDAILHPNSPKDIEISEIKTIASSRIVFTDNHHLLKKCQVINPQTFMIAPGVDFEHFARHNGSIDAKLLANIKKPRICYFGGIDDIRLDIDLIEYIAKDRPNWNIVMFGPVIKTDVSGLKLNNVFFWGQLRHNVLPDSLQEMDVLMLPYKIIPFSKSIFPAKIFECLATGKPVVSTPLEELYFFDEGIIKIVATKEEFVRAIEYALTHDSQQEKNKRLKVAKENSWAQRFKEIQDIIGAQL